MQKNFVIFCSPGSFVSETSEKPVESWDTDKAIEMAREIKERYNATPYGFYFVTRGRNEDELDSKVIKTSPFYYLGGKVLTKEEVLADTNPDLKILRTNVEINDMKKIIINDNSWRFTAELKPTDIVLDFVCNP